MIVVQQDGASPVLTEMLADSEAQLQELVKTNPDLIPIDEFGMTGPLMVVGRETTLASGAVDLVCLARSGELLVIEFKTGPQNSDFRHALAQMLDYGANLWEMSFDEFESTVPVRYFSSDACTDPRLRGKQSLAEAVSAFWPDMAPEGVETLNHALAGQLKSGAFHYILAAQRFTATMERTITYMNGNSGWSQFYAIELVRFASNGIDAFEARTVLRPADSAPEDQAAVTNESKFLAAVRDTEHRQALHELFEVLRGLKIRPEWGSSGTSFRLRTTDRTEPLTVGWVFHEEGPGWMGLRGLNLGYDPGSAEKHPSVAAALDRYIGEVRALPGSTPVKPTWLRAYQVAPATIVAERNRITEILAALAQDPTETSG